MTGGRGLSRAEQRMTAREPRLWIPAFAGMTRVDIRLRGNDVRLEAISPAVRRRRARASDPGNGNAVPARKRGTGTAYLGGASPRKRHTVPYRSIPKPTPAD